MESWLSHSVPRIPGEPRPLRLYDTSTGEVRPTAPGPTARMYVCGITPYDATHLGHAATYLAFDLVHRQWLDNRHDVHYVQNVTDIDDPLLERAERDHDDWVVLGMRETALFREDMEALRVVPPRDYVGADEHPDIYFDHTATGRFGYESNYDEPTMLTLFAERGGDPDRPGKRHPLDPVLWRTARPGEPAWDTEIGAGRPGWHIECTAIALNRLGSGIDVQGGGSDLAYPHHECSAAHAEALTGTHPFARHYTHSAMIGLDGEKMSKSRGNLVFVSRLRADGVDPMAVRLALFAGHYRTDRAWTKELLAEGLTRVDRWRSAMTGPTGPSATDTITRLRDHLSDDLDTPAALAAVDAWAAEALTGHGTDADAPGELRAAVDALLGVAL
jgi:L-cysteine:1D-myo-inositol 2-amino-2-deoxy-alpha-D-glucopyranoside ligase